MAVETSARTKFMPPQLREDIISRERLLRRLRNVVSSHPLTLVAAPAGYGKTTLLSTMAASNAADAPIAWLTLDDEDDSPSQLLAALIGAIQRVSPECGQGAHSLLGGAGYSIAPISPEQQTRNVVNVLVNEIDETMTDPFILVLDDLHKLREPQTHLVLEQLLDKCPVALHLVIATRQDPPLPLARMRARGELAELRLDNLRFSDAEAAAFLNDMLALDLQSADLEKMQAHTEGWPVGLRLFASSYAGLNDAASQQALMGRMIDQTDRYVFDFLAAEVLAREESEVQTFLLETSILAELTPEICAILTGREDAGEMLSELYRRNLFLVAAESGFGIFRYHDLFAEFLQQQQAASTRIQELHARAGKALEATHPRQSIKHYLAAKLWSRAAAQIERLGWEMINRWDYQPLRAWIEAIPERERAATPVLNLFLGVIHFLILEFEPGQALLERTLDSFSGSLATAERNHEADGFSWLAYCVWAQGEIKRSGKIFARALKLTAALDTRARLLAAVAIQKLMESTPASVAQAAELSRS